VEVGRVVTPGSRGDGHLRVIDAREVACARGLVFFGLERERIRIDTGVGGAGVMVEGLHLVEVLTGLFLETVLAVEDKLHGTNGTDSFFRELRRATVGTNLKQGGAGQGRRDERVRRRDRSGVGLEDDLIIGSLGREVPETLPVVVLRETPDQLLDGVVVRQADLLGTSGGEHTVNTGVLHLLDQVFVTLLGEAATLLGVKVDVVSPHLEGLGIVGVFSEIGGQVEIQTDFVVLKRDEGQRQTGVAVEEEDQGQEHLRVGLPSGHLTPRSLLGLVQVKLRVQTPPFLVVLVNALTTDGKLNILDGTFRQPTGIDARGSGTRRDGSRRLEFDVHVVDKVTVTGDSHGDASGVASGTVDGLLDVLHREVCVASVDSLEKGNLRVSGKVDVLGAIGDELHETTGHFELLYYTPTFFLSREKHGTIFPRHT